MSLAILIVVHTTVSFFAVYLMVLVTIGFAPHLMYRLRGHTKNSMMSWFVALSGGLAWVRLLWWSLLRPFLGWAGVMNPAPLNLMNQSVNTLFAVWTVLAALAGLAALHKSLPLEEQKNYNWLTVPFYPRRLTLIWRS